ncbi:MAG: EAL domain-containing protein [Thermoleophilia bacterium]|nr:EAL domain-containing protein [Thermoleophilia bacterium]
MGDEMAARQLSSATFRGVAARAEQHLERLLAALPWGVAVVSGGHVLVSNPVADARLPGPRGGTFTLADAARMAAEAPVIVPDAEGRAVRVTTRPIVWDHSDCVLVITEPHHATPADARPVAGAPGPPAPAALPVPQDPAEVRASVPPPPDVPDPPAPPAGETWTPVVDVAGGRVAGFTADPGPDADEPALQRCLVRAIGALSEWGRGRSALETPLTVVRVPAAATLDAGLVAFVEAVTRRAPAHVQRLWLRVHRSALEGASASQCLVALRRLGPRVMVEDVDRDDPVSGIAPLPVDGVTISPATVASGDWALIHSALSIARHHGLATLATGVGDPQAHERLRAVGCRWAEGPTYPPPVSRSGALALYGSPVRPRPGA